MIPEKKPVNPTILKGLPQRSGNALLGFGTGLFSTATSKYRVPFRQNRLLQVYSVIFLLFWGYTGFFTSDFRNWMLENTLTFSYVILVVAFYSHYQFSDLSYTGMFVFLLLHVYGSQHAYAENPLGYWLQYTFGLERNHYDRLVHLAFGLLLSYPMLELIQVAFKVKSGLAYVWPPEFTLALSAFYELVEWLVAGVFFPDKGPAFLGMQGDIWDAQIDMALAFAGAVLVIAVIWLRRRLNFIKTKTAL